MTNEENTTEGGKLTWARFRRKVPAVVKALEEAETRPDIAGYGGSFERQVELQKEIKPAPKPDKNSPEELDKAHQHKHRDTFLEHNT